MSCDVALGVPFNIVQYALMAHMLAHVCNMTTDEFIWDGGDVHIYSNQWDGVKEQLSRSIAKYPETARVELNPEVKSIFDFTLDDVKVVDYESYPTIKFPAAAV